MNLIEFVQDLSIQGWKLWIEDEQLCIDAPENESFESIFSQLKQHKIELIELLKQQPHVLQVSPLSYGQQGLWFLWQLSPRSHAYNVSFAVRIYAEIDLSLWQQVFAIFRHRHPILCSTFSKRGRGSIQQTHPQQSLDFLQIDASGWNEDKLHAQVVAAHRHPFNLEAGPVMRVRWFTCSVEDHVLLVSIHHIVLDGTSAHLMIKELSDIHQALRSGVEPSLPSLTHTYQDYVHWQQELVAGPEGERLWNYWKQQLAGELPVLNLPTDRPPPLDPN